MRTKIDIQDEINAAISERNSLASLSDEAIEIAYEGMNRQEVEMWITCDLLPSLEEELAQLEQKDWDLADPVGEIFGSYKAMYCM